MKRYEMIREIFNLCSGNQMRDVDISEIESDNIDEVVNQFLVGAEVTCEKRALGDKVTVFDIVTDGVMQKVTFNEY